MPTNPVDSESVELDASESHSGTLEWSSTSGEVGDWTAEVRSDDDAAIQSVTVEEATTSPVSGTFTLDGSGTSGATIIGINDTQNTIAGMETTDVNGDYAIEYPIGDEGHLLFQYDDGETQYSDESKPFIAVE